ncbi:MAG: C40 family peptidase [Kaiparowitsia implicata GSE-PSE-MK54-09C]|jgi:cell wall-associated NlpC family hydrolase|nr:C40 family peptidase [Kaiparowitsia implicata GSE-PSE-MK54-09C]
MVSFAAVQSSHVVNPSAEYRCTATLNLYDAPTLHRLATQAAAGRQLRILPPQGDGADGEALAVVLCEDNYPGWISLADLAQLEPAASRYRAIARSTAKIRQSLPQVLAFATAALHQPNEYRWGGTTAPNYDCSGLVQAAFASVGVWLPRDAYQQEAFVQPVSVADRQPGDLIFFGQPDRCTHVALALEGDRYLHSSGKDMGRNGIGIDRLADCEDVISRAYFRQLRGVGRVVASYCPKPDH